MPEQAQPTTEKKTEPTPETVVLIKHYVQPKTGNQYLPGDYAKEALPEEIRENRFYVRSPDQVDALPKDPTTMPLTPVAPQEQTQHLIPSALQEKAINLNTADEATLKTIEGIDEKHIPKIISLRKEKPFESIDDVKERIKGSESWVGNGSVTV
jgi:hypothetical protein